jgi:uracil-DNA glycosylase
MSAWRHGPQGLAAAPAAGERKGRAMRPCDLIRCEGFPCGDVRHECYLVPDVELDPRAVRIVLISEAAPADAGAYFYAAGDPLFARTTVQAFRDAAAAAEEAGDAATAALLGEVGSIEDIVRLGVYLTTAIKCGKTGYGVSGGTVKTCAEFLLEAELALFPNVRAYLLMGDVAIKAVNSIAVRESKRPATPSGPTYKIRGPEYRFRGVRAFPSYLQAGPSFFIEKSKRRMIAQDIAAAMGVAMSAT